jgi:hypothetical protein
MEVSAVSSDLPTLVVAAQQQQASNAIQLEILKDIADSQQQVAMMLAAMGLGQNLDVSG